LEDRVKTALVVEGGGMCGVFAAGVIDCFLAENFDPFNEYFGVSAGACNLAALSLLYSVYAQSKLF